MTLWDVEWFSNRVEGVKRKTWPPLGEKKHPRRAILKDGHKNVYRNKIKTLRHWRFLQDIFTTLLDAQWRWTLQFLALQFFGCWLAFALIWWLIAFVHGDLQEDHLPINQQENGWTPCVLNINSFHSAFLYSLETQHTTGYGSRAITEECPEAIFLLVCQCLIGLTLDSFAISIVFAKLIRSKHATNTIQFSRNAVVGIRDGKMCFMFRVGDIRRSRLAGVSVRAILLRSIRTSEGEVIQNHQIELPLKADGGNSNLFLLWPTTLYHEIDEKSPLYDTDLVKTQKIEIMVLLSGTVMSTGVSIEAKSSYLSNEILFNYKFMSAVTYNKDIQCYEVDWDRFDLVVQINQESVESALKSPTDDNTTKTTSKKLFNKRDYFQRQHSKYDNYCDTINESDENSELLPITAV